MLVRVSSFIYTRACPRRVARAQTASTAALVGTALDSLVWFALVPLCVVKKIVL